MTIRELHLWLARSALQRSLRTAEQMLPAVSEALPPDRRHRARWAFAQLKDAVEGRQSVSRPGAAVDEAAT